MNWENLRKSLKELAIFLDNAAVINNRMAVVNSWIRMSDEGAFNSITTFVQSSPVQEVDQQDAVLLMMASKELDEEACCRLIKFYAVFRMAAFIRDGRFRDFPYSILISERCDQQPDSLNQ